MILGMARQFDVAIAGAGILGLAHAYHYAKAGKRVAVFERGERALGASVRNFGMVWPVGQPPGEMREMAVASRGFWLEVLGASGIWHLRSGSMHLAYHEDELAVLEEFVTQQPGYGATVISPSEVLQKTPVVRPDGLLGGMWSADEVCVDPRDVIASLPTYLRYLGVEFFYGSAVSHVETGRLVAGGEEFLADQLLLCTGDDFETLFPERFASSGMVRCKLQMLKARPQAAEYQIRTHLCAGLTLGHYANFKGCQTLVPVLKRFERELPEHLRWGIHLLVSQHESGDLTIGDSHEYGMSHDPFLRESIDRLILQYLDTFLDTSQFDIVERWHGVYAKHPTKSYIVDRPCSGVTVVTGVGGAGMTLSFGLADRVCRGLV